MVCDTGAGNGVADVDDMVAIDEGAVGDDPQAVAAIASQTPAAIRASRSISN
jgi:hypothetical protein